MKKSIRIVAILLAVSMFLGGFGVNSFAAELSLPNYTMSETEWNEYWKSVKNDNTQVALTVGADETELNFNWHSERKIAIPRVRISENENMSDFIEFCGYSTLAEDDWQTNRVTVTGLEENTKYYYTYSIGKDSWSEPDFYRTLSSSSFKALLVGDIQCSEGDDGYGEKDAANWNTLLNTALKNNTDTSIILSCGDQTQTGASSSEWAATLSPKAMRNLPMATCIGNHDNKGTYYKYYVNNPNSYNSLIPNSTGKPYYFRYGDVLFVSLNTTSLDVMSSYNLVEKAVSENPDAKWRVAMFHHDVYGTGHHAVDNDNYLLQGVYASVMDKFEFDVALTGHEHYYGRSYNMLNNEIVDLDYTKNSVVDPDGTLYITTASASGKNRVYDEPYNHSWMNYSYMSSELIYSTVEFTENTFSIKTYTVEENKQIDDYSITKTSSEYSEVDTSDNVFDTDALSRVLSHFMGEYYVIIEVFVSLINTVRNLFNIAFVK